MEQKRLTLLGSTGSIGTQVLDIVSQHGYTVCGLAAKSNVDLLEQQIRRFRPPLAAMFDEEAARDLRVRVADLPVKVLSGQEGLCELAADPNADMTVNAVIGMVGLMPTLAAIEAGHDVALANKETLVAGGEIVMNAAAQKSVKILPIDSEHSAIFQCLQASSFGQWAPPEKLRGETHAIKKLILTASGGPFFGRSREELKNITPAQALKHPNWSMGRKISIDSATMMNKGLELIEARWLFDMDPGNIDVVVHRQSIVHSMIEFCDGSVLAQMGVPDMRVPIQYALTWPERIPSPTQPLKLTEIGKLTFEEPDHEVFPCMEMCRRAITMGSLYPAAVNAANEQAVEMFLNGEIGFLDIEKAVGEMFSLPLQQADKAEDVIELDAQCRRMVRERLAGKR